MADLVRARLENGTEASIGAVLAEISGAEVLDEPTHNDDGTLREPTRNGRPEKPKTTVAKAAAGKADKPADNG